MKNTSERGQRCIVFIRVKKEGKYAEVIFSTNIREAISAN